VLKEGVAQQFGIYDVDALYAYFQGQQARYRRHQPDRIVRGELTTGRVL